MAFIVEQLAGDRAIQLGYEEVIRPFSFGTNWEKIRVGVLWALNGYYPMADATTPHLGICTGYTGRWSASSTDVLFVPMIHEISSSGSSLGGTPPAVFYQLNSGTSTAYAKQRVGTTTTNTSAAVSSLYTQISGNPSNHYTGAYFTITKGTVGAAAIAYDIIAPPGGGTAGATAISRGTFLAQMENETAANSPNQRYAAATSNLPIRYNKDWDSMVVGWMRSTPTLSIACMTVVRFA